MPETTFPTPTTGGKAAWRRRVKDGYRPRDAQAGTIMHAHENGDYSALLQAIKRNTLWDDGCWAWLGQIKPDGSAWAYLRAGSVRVRRLVAEAFVGAPLDSRDKIFGACGRTDCVNPEHLEIRTYVR